MTSNNTRPDAVHVDVIGDKDGGNRVRSLGSASILGILPEGHPWTVARTGGESECCGTFHVDVEGQTTHIRCVTSGATILSGRGLAKTLQMMADMGNAPVIVGHDPGASSSIKNAEYAPSGEFAPVAAPIAEVATVAEVTEVPAYLARALADGDDISDPAVIRYCGILAARELIKERDRVYSSEIGNFADTVPVVAWAEAVAEGTLTLVNDGSFTRYIRTMRTADGVKISDGLAVWDYNLAPGTVKLSSVSLDGWFDVILADGSRSYMNPVRVCVKHPASGDLASLALADLSDLAEGNAQRWAEAGSPRDAEGQPIIPTEAEDIPTEAEVTALIAEHDAAMEAWSRPLVSALTAMATPVEAEAEVSSWERATEAHAALKAAQLCDRIEDKRFRDLASWGQGAATGKVWTASGRLVDPGPTEAEVWAGTGTVVTYPISRPIRTNLAKRARKSARRARRGIKGGF